MKKMILLALILTGCLLTACSTEIPLDDANTEIVAEYVADLLLRYGSDAPSKLVYEEPTVEPTASAETVTTPEPTTNPTVTAEPTPAATAVPPAQTTAPTVVPTDGQLTVNTTPVSLEAIYGYSDVTFSVSGCKTYQSYPENASAYCITARDGYKLFVITLSAENNGGNAVDLDMSKKDITYHLNVGGKWYSSLKTILDNDVQFLKGKLEAGKKMDFIIAFELEENVDTKDAAMVALQDVNSCEVKLN